MAHLNWRPGMWPPGSEAAAWDHPNQGQAAFSDGRLKRHPSNQSMSSFPIDNNQMMNMWPQHLMHPAHISGIVCHPSVYPPYHGMAGPMMFSGSQGHLVGVGMPPVGMMMGNVPSTFDQRPVSPASSHQSRRSAKGHRSHRSSQKEARAPASRSASSKQWSGSEDDRGFSDELDSPDERPVSPRQATARPPASRSSASHAAPAPKPTQTKAQAIYGRVSPLLKSEGWECEHCTFINEPETRVCAVCCRTSQAWLNSNENNSAAEQQSDSAADCGSADMVDDDCNLSVVKSNLSFKLKEDTHETVAVEFKNQKVVTKDADKNKGAASDYQGAVKDYEDVSNMLKRLQMKKKDDYQEEKKTEDAKQQERLKEEAKHQEADKEEARETYYEQVQYATTEREGNYYIYPDDGYSCATDRYRMARFQQ